METTMFALQGLRTEIATGSDVVVAVDDASFQIPAGGTFALVGESGCGKSMTALSILRLLPDNGRLAGGAVRIDGVDLAGLPERQMREVRGGRIGIIFQEPATSLNPVLSIGRQLIETIERHTPLRGADARERALQWLRRVEVPDPERRMGEYPFQLSGGQKQRVMIAIALSAEPELLVADEPTTALDVTIQAQILKLLAQLQGEQKMAMLLITHDLAVVSQIAQRVALMYAGQVVELADAAEFFSDPRHPYARLLFGALPQSARRGQALTAIAGTVPRLDRPFAGCRFVGRCPSAVERCSTTQPELREVAPGHSVRCLLDVADHAAASTKTLAPSIALTPGPSPTGVGEGRSSSPLAGVGELSRSSPLPGVGEMSRSSPLPLAGEGPGVRADAPPILQVRDYRVWFPIRSALTRRTVGYVKAVDGIGFSIRPGRTLALVGESGCGKTTTGKALLQLYRHVARVQGEALLDGEPLAQLHGEALQRARRKIQIVFQDPYSSLNPRMRVVEILEEGIATLRSEVSSRDRRQRIATLLDQVGLRTDTLHRYPHEFSGGQRQRIAIARALAVQPQLIVCDEPTSALDVSVQAQILNLLTQLQRELGVAYLFITHNFGVVEFLAHEVAVMRDGRIVESGPAQRVLEHPEHEYTKALLAAVPRVTWSV
jgi:peptide/nickel transport system ATP-binding protein